MIRAFQGGYVRFRIDALHLRLRPVAARELDLPQEASWLLTVDDATRAVLCAALERIFRFGRADQQPTLVLPPS